MLSKNDRNRHRFSERGLSLCFFKNILALAFLIGGVVAEIAWLGFCFGTVVIGIALLFIAPKVLLAPMVMSFELAGITNSGCD